METHIENKIQTKVPLAAYTTLQIGGVADYFIEVGDQNEIIEAIQWSQKNHLSFFVLGGGSNLLVSDEGYRGIIIKIKNGKLKIKNLGEKAKIIEVGAGVRLSELVKLSIQEGLSGLEWAVGIPRATIGGAVAGNSGSKEYSISDICQNVIFYNAKINKVRNFSQKQCKFKYRQSIFQANKDFVIVNVVLKLKKINSEEIKQRIDTILAKRAQSQEIKLPSCGSVFKNPSSSCFAGQLIEQCGLKGKQIGQAKISEKHSNFIVNLGKASASDVKALIDLAKQQVKEKFSVILEEEVRFLGFEI